MACPKESGMFRKRLQIVSVASGQEGKGHGWGEEWSLIGGPRVVWVGGGWGATRGLSCWARCLGADRAALKAMSLD